MSGISIHISQRDWRQRFDEAALGCGEVQHARMLTGSVPGAKAGCSTYLKITEEMAQELG